MEIEDGEEARFQTEDGEEGVIKFQSFREEYVHVGHLSPHKASGKYYKQTYRKQWEDMPDFKGWLRGLPGQPTRAFCVYCQKSLHAHRLSLLKHTCTIRHQKAAQMNFVRQEKQGTVQIDSVQMEKVGIVLASAGSSQDPEDQENENEELEEMVEFSDSNVVSIEEPEQEDEEDEEDVDDDEESIVLENLPIHVQKQVRQQGRVTIMTAKPPISTHVLDTAKGNPVAGLQVSLYKLIEGRWTYINEGITNTDGRFANFLTNDDFSAGRYKLHFDVDRYFELKKQETLYPFIEIVFDCKAPTDHYHVPLLLSPYGYTTYRGS